MPREWAYARLPRSVDRSLIDSLFDSFGDAEEQAQLFAESGFQVSDPTRFWPYQKDGNWVIGMGHVIGPVDNLDESQQSELSKYQSRGMLREAGYAHAIEQAQSSVNQVTTNLRGNALRDIPQEVRTSLAEVVLYEGEQVINDDVRRNLLERNYQGTFDALAENVTNTPDEVIVSAGETAVRVGDAPGTEDIVTEILRNTAINESSFADFRNMGQIISEANGTKSYGILGLNSGRQASGNDFVRDHGGNLGLTAPIGSAEFDQQWQAVSSSNPEALIQAHREYTQEHVISPAQDVLRQSGLAQYDNDPGLINMASDMLIQYGPRLTRANLEQGAQRGSTEVPNIIRDIGQATIENVDANFQTHLGQFPEQRTGLINRLQNRTEQSVKLAGNSRRRRAPATTPVQPEVQVASVAPITQQSPINVAANNNNPTLPVSREDSTLIPNNDIASAIPVTRDINPLTPSPIQQAAPEQLALNQQTGLPVGAVEIPPEFRGALSAEAQAAIQNLPGDASTNVRRTPSFVGPATDIPVNDLPPDFVGPVLEQAGPPEPPQQDLGIAGRLGALARDFSQDNAVRQERERLIGEEFGRRLDGFTDGVGNIAGSIAGSFGDAISGITDSFSEARRNPDTPINRFIEARDGVNPATARQEEFAQSEQQALVDRLLAAPDSISNIGDTTPGILSRNATQPPPISSILGTTPAIFPTETDLVQQRRRSQPTAADELRTIRENFQADVNQVNIDQQLQERLANQQQAIQRDQQFAAVNLLNQLTAGSGEGVNNAVSNLDALRNAQGTGQTVRTTIAQGPSPSAAGISRLLTAQENAQEFNDPRNAGINRIAATGDVLEQINANRAIQGLPAITATDTLTPEAQTRQQFDVTRNEAARQNRITALERLQRRIFNEAEVDGLNGQLAVQQELLDLIPAQLAEVLQRNQLRR